MRRRLALAAVGVGLLFLAGALSIALRHGFFGHQLVDTEVPTSNPGAQRAHAEAESVVKALVQEGSGLPTLANSSRPSSRPRTSVSGPGLDPEWASLERNDRSIVALFLKAAPAVKSKLLLRNATLNFTDDYVRPGLRAELDSIIDAHVAHLVKAMKEASRLQHQEMLRLRELNALRPVTKESVGAEVWEKAERITGVLNSAASNRNGESRRALRSKPQDYIVMHADEMIPGGAAAFLDTKQGTFIATAEQLKAIAPLTQYIEFQKQDFLFTVVAWFQSVVGCVDVARVDRELQEITRAK